MTGIYQKVFLRALSWLWDRGNRRRNGGDMTEWSLWHSKAFTATPSWLSSFSSPIFIHTSLSGHSVHHMSLTLSVVLLKFNLLSNFSGCNILYRLLEASQELTVLYFLLPTPVVSPLLLLYSFPNSSWPYGPTSHIGNMSYSSLFPCWHPLLWTSSGTITIISHGLIMSG